MVAAEAEATGEKRSQNDVEVIAQARGRPSHCRQTVQIKIYNVDQVTMTGAQKK